MPVRPAPKRRNAARPAEHKAAPTEAARQVRKKLTAAAAAARQRTVTPYLAVSDAAKALAWYAEAFGAKELSRNLVPNGKIMHAAMQVGDSTVYLSDVFPGSELSDPQTLGGTCVNLHIYHKDVDRLWQRAVDAGATVTMQLANQFWGERYGKIRDPFGHSWAFACEAEMSEDERERMQAAAMRMFSTGLGRES
ncbi:MAG: VOC family protein [Thermoplasmatota archaeon]